MAFQRTEPDQVEVVTNYSLTIDTTAGTVSGTSQKVDNNKTDGESTAESEPVDLALTADEQSTILADLDASLTKVLDARAAAAPAQS